MKDKIDDLSKWRTTTDIISNAITLRKKSGFVLVSSILGVYIDNGFEDTDIETFL